MASRAFTNQGDIDAPYSSGFAIVTHDVNPLARTTRSIYCGGAGNITLRLEDDTADVVLTGCLVGHVYRVRATHVRATGTTATNLVALD